MLASQALMKPMQMSVKIRTICRRYEKKGASHRSRRHNTKVVNLSGGVIRQSAWRFAPKRAEFYEFLAPVNKSSAARAVQALTKSPTILLVNPRIGEQLFQFEPREVRRILVGEYEVRYEIQDSIIYVLRLWHTREDR